METLKDHVIVYDKECPLCDWYTAAFIKANMLEEDGRMPFDEAQWLMKARRVDHQRARNEIALVNTRNGRILYGVDSLMHILQSRYPFLSGIFSSGLFYGAARRLYSFISYNRKVIVPGKQFETACAPRFNLKYRLGYVILAWIVCSTVLVRFSHQLQPLVPATNFFREFLVCGGQLLFQGALAWIVYRERTVHYLGNLMTVSLMGAVLLVPALILAPLMTPMIAVVYFASVVGLMFLEHIRRTRVLGLPWVMTFGWALYRLGVLALIL